MALSNIEKLIEALDIEPCELFIFDKDLPKNIIFDDLLTKDDIWTVFKASKK